ncbi:hypothetical protein PDR5_07140 [Pseudomonas sp. DR 5-09]|nr:hypothetical protein PDR5_07140 [Pseudomonas sp. DR 5-09]
MQLRCGRGVWHDRLGLLGVVPVDKAISWPLSQERRWLLFASLWRRACESNSVACTAPLEGKAFDQAPVLPATG